MRIRTRYIEVEYILIFEPKTNKKNYSDSRSSSSSWLTACLVGWMNEWIGLIWNSNHKFFFLSQVCWSSFFLLLFWVNCVGIDGYLVVDTRFIRRFLFFFMLVLLTGYCLFGLFFVLCVYFILGSTNFLPIPGTVCHFFCK